MKYGIRWSSFIELRLRYSYGTVSIEKHGDTCKFFSCKYHGCCVLNKLNYIYTHTHTHIKAVSQHTYGEAGREEVYLLLIHDLGTRWGEWSASRPGRALPPVPTVQEAGWAPDEVWTQRLEEKSSCLYRRSNLDRLLVQSVDRHYSDWATPAPYTYIHTHTHTMIDYYSEISGSHGGEYEYIAPCSLA
jgi:hypothetical protein